MTKNIKIVGKRYEPTGPVVLKDGNVVEAEASDGTRYFVNLRRVRKA